MELNATIPALVEHGAAAFPGETILRKKDRGIWNAIPWSALDQAMRGIGQGFRAAGLAPGEIVAMLSETRPELVYADLAVLGCGAVSLALPTDQDADGVAAALIATNAAFVLVEGEEQLDKILSVRARLPALRRIVIMDMKGLREFSDPGCLSLSDLIAGGEGQSDWKAQTRSVRPDQTAALVHGPDGGLRPLTHARIVQRVEAAARDLGVTAGDERLAVLSMADPAERILGLYLALKTRMISNYLENPETATENLREVKPTVFGSNREAWERLHARITALAEAATGVQKSLYRMAIGSGGPLVRAVVLPAVLSELGFGKLRVAYVGDGDIPAPARDWARALGIEVRKVDPFQA